MRARGNGQLEAITVRESGSEEELPAGALFVFTGAAPRTDWLGDLVTRDERGFILSGPHALRSDGGDTHRRWPLERDPLFLETSVPGIFVAGEVRDQSIKRVASAVGGGAMAGPAHPRVPRWLLRAYRVAATDELTRDRAFRVLQIPAGDTWDDVRDTDEALQGQTLNNALAAIRFRYAARHLPQGSRGASPIPEIEVSGRAVAIAPPQHPA